MTFLLEAFLLKNNERSTCKKTPSHLLKKMRETYKMKRDRRECMNFKGVC
jgi:hypothetical protein